MLENDRSQKSEVLAPPPELAFWQVRGESVRLVYPLPLFHEIDFFVNEGFRKIPHGGIETAGLLFGAVVENEIRIEAFREIECEHASGPSLVFSQRDLAALNLQIQGAGLERELEKLQLVGWFLGHTRAALEMTELEISHFNRFIPGALRVSVIVKPERFQPTRFGFVIRKADGVLTQDASGSAIILPLPGRSSKSGQISPSIPAPAPSVSAKARAKARAMEEETEKALDEIAPDVQNPVVGETAVQRYEGSKPLPEPDVVEAQAADEEPVPVPKPSEGRRALARDKQRLIEAAFPTPPPEPTPAPAFPERLLATHPGSFQPMSATGFPRDAGRFSQSAYNRQPPQQAPMEAPVVASSVINSRSVTALALAALLGCLVGYVAYLQLPAPVIPIDVRALDKTVVVSWPPDETRDAVYAAFRLNDGLPVVLSAEEKRTGQIAIPATGDFKLEVVSRNWIRDSRGIVRYLRSTPNADPKPATDLPPSP